MNRRDFLRRAAVVAAGAIAADQLELLERLSHAKIFTTGGYAPTEIIATPWVARVVDVDCKRGIITVESQPFVRDSGLIYIGGGYADVFRRGDLIQGWRT